MEKELKDGPGADRVWYQNKEKKKKTEDANAKPKVSKIKQKRKAAKDEAPTASKEADFFAREAKRNRKLKKIRAYGEDDNDRQGRKRPQNFQNKNKKKQRL
jgi:hypothetical protein